MTGVQTCALPISDLHTLVPELPIGLCDAVAIALRYDREQRFASVAAFRDAVHDVTAGFMLVEPGLPDASVIADAAITEPVNIVPEPEPRRTNAIVWVVVGAAFLAAFGVMVGQLERQTFPPQAPVKKFAAVSTAPPVTVIVEPTPAPVRQEPVERPANQPPKQSVVPVPPPMPPREDEEAKRQRELEALRTAIDRGLDRAEAGLRAENFSAALEELDRTAAMAQRWPADLRNERDEIAHLRDRVVGAQVVARTRDAQAALWASRLAEIEEDLRAGRWPEAERFAAGIVRDPRAPAPVVARANELLLQAKEGRKNAFRDTQLGPTTNVIRKPSSPPGNDR